MTEPAKETVIIVHGTFAAPQPGESRWYQPSEGLAATKGFVAKLDAALQERGSQARCWAHCSQGDRGFHWSGENSWVARTRAAAELGSYVLNLQKNGWCCHMVAHSHGGNVVLEALPQITTALPSRAPLGKITTLGTPFMDTMSPILEIVRRRHSFLTRLSSIALVLVSFLPIILALSALCRLAGFPAAAAVTITFPPIAFALLFFSHKFQTEPILSRAAQAQPELLAIGSKYDEPWQLLHYLRNAPNPMAVENKLISYLVSSMQSHVALHRQVAQIYEAKSYGDLKWMARLFLALTHLLSFLVLSFVLLTISFTIAEMLHYWVSGGRSWQWLTPREMIYSSGIGFVIFAILSVSILLFTRMFGTEFYSAFLSPFRWCVFYLSAVKGIGRDVATYVVRSRGWSVVLTIAMGLEGYRLPLPRIEQRPSSVPVTYENMPRGAQQRALATRGEWIDRHLNDAAQTFSRLVVTSADIKLLMRAIEADRSLVHAAYYTDDECIARIANWIAARDDLHSNAAIAA